jgi:hypothetical protein
MALSKRKTGFCFGRRLFSYYSMGQQTIGFGREPKIPFKCSKAQAQWFTFLQYFLSFLSRSIVPSVSLRVTDRNPANHFARHFHKEFSFYRVVPESLSDRNPASITKRDSTDCIKLIIISPRQMNLQTEVCDMNSVFSYFLKERMFEPVVVIPVKKPRVRIRR